MVIPMAIGTFLRSAASSTVCSVSGPRRRGGSVVLVLRLHLRLPCLSRLSLLSPLPLRQHFHSRSNYLTVTWPSSHSPNHGTSNEWAPTGPAPAVHTTRSYYHHAVIVTSDPFGRRASGAGRPCKNLRQCPFGSYLASKPAS